MIDVPIQCPEGWEPGKIQMRMFEKLYSYSYIKFYLVFLDRRGKCREIWGF